MKFDGVKKLMKEGLSADTISIIQLRMTRKGLRDYQQKQGYKDARRYKK